MGLLNKLRGLTQKTEPEYFKHLDRLYSGWDAGIQWCFTLECWDVTFTPEQKQREIEWAKKRLWQNKIAYRILRKVKNGDSDK